MTEPYSPPHRLVCPLGTVPCPVRGNSPLLYAHSCGVRSKIFHNSSLSGKNQLLSTTPCGVHWKISGSLIVTGDRYFTFRPTERYGVFLAMVFVARPMMGETFSILWTPLLNVLIGNPSPPVSLLDQAVFLLDDITPVVLSCWGNP